MVKPNLSGLLVASTLLVLGCEGKGGPEGDDGPMGPSFATLAVTTTVLPDAELSVAYSETLVATGGDSSYTWLVTVGSLPTGLSLATTGAISGTPTVVETSDFTVEVMSGDGQEEILSSTDSGGSRNIRKK